MLRFSAKWATGALGIILGFRYFYWRGTYTLNTETRTGLGISLLLLLAEAYGFLATVLFYIQVAKPTNRVPIMKAESDLPSVDIFITIYNESLEILYPTLVGCMSMDYPSDKINVYVLDDGQSKEVQSLAERLGCNYVTRASNKNAKAGNLNHGLSQSSGEYVVVLDCDHIPVRTFVKETIGFFDDEKVAFVQTPHYFYNPDTFQRNLRLEREIVNEQDLFFYVIQPGRDTYNSSFFAGTGGVFRRSALDEIEGFQSLTMTEDLHTSMVLHSKGYRSVYLNKILAAGLSPESYRDYLKQRQRWTRGGIQVSLMDNPLWKRGLTLMQRINYFASIFFFLHGFSRIMYLIAPLSLLLLGIPPLIAPLPMLLSYFFPYYVASMMTSNVISKNFRNPFWGDIYETVMCFFISWTSIETIFSAKKSVFNVTPKGLRVEKPQLDWSYVMPHIFLSFLLTVGLVVGVFQLWFHSLNTNVTLWSLVWTAYNIMIVGSAIVVARGSLQKRRVPRLPRRISCELMYSTRTFKGTTSDLSETGLSMIVDRPVSLPEQVVVHLRSDFGELTKITGKTVRNDLLSSGVSKICVGFVNVSETQHQSLIRQMFSSPSSWEEVHQSTSNTWRSFRHLAASTFIPLLKQQIIHRFSSRIRERMVCKLVVEEQVFEGVMEDISTTGLSVHLATDETLSTEVIVQIYKGGKLVFSILGEIVRSKKTKETEILYGIRFLESKDLDFLPIK
ncbi:MAG: glycosyltransferase family 2 protein [Nitrospira sp.]